MITLIEDDKGLSDALIGLFETNNLKAEHFVSGEAFLESFDITTKTNKEENISEISPGIYVLDIRLPGISGIEIFDEINNRVKLNHRPIIMMTGHGDVEIAVSLLKKGAFDFLTKPVKTDNLMSTINKAYSSSKDLVDSKNFIINFEFFTAKLTAREKETADLIAANYTNRIIAETLGISVRTIELHRARIFEKMEISTAGELSSKYEKYSFSKKFFEKN